MGTNVPVRGLLGILASPLSRAVEGKCAVEGIRLGKVAPSLLWWFCTSGMVPPLPQANQL